MLTNNPPKIEIAKDTLAELAADTDAALEAMQGSADSEDEAKELEALLERAKALRGQVKADKEAAIRPAKDAFDQANRPWLDLQKKVGESAKRTGVFGKILPALDEYQLARKQEQEAMERAAKAERYQAYQSGDMAGAREAQDALEAVEYVKHTRKFWAFKLTDREAAIAHILTKAPEYFDGEIERFVRGAKRDLGIEAIPGAYLEEERRAA